MGSSSTGLMSGGGGTYIGFEPDPVAFRALSANLGSDTVYPIALAESPGRRELWLSTAGADSSLIPPQDRVRASVWADCVSLDEFVLENEIGTIDLLKIEAEGSEPEVIRGGLRTLESTRYLALDAGPERGGVSPAQECLDLLDAAGFSVLDQNARMGRFLLQRL